MSSRRFAVAPALDSPHDNGRVDDHLTAIDIDLLLLGSRCLDLDVVVVHFRVLR